MSVVRRLPAIRTAKLPGLYVGAKDALARCEKVDECKEWADKATAIASYARQAQDDELLKTATRIKARAIRRCGQLLKEIKRPEQGGRPKKNGVAAGPVSRKAAADTAGLSDRQRKDALRVASIPAGEFEKQVESDDPPTVSELSEAGKRAAANLAYLRSPKPPGFTAATTLLGSLERLRDFCGKHEPTFVAEALSKRESAHVLRDLDLVTAWLKALRRVLP